MPCSVYNIILGHLMLQSFLSDHTVLFPVLFYSVGLHDIIVSLQYMKL